jgi:ABC-type phosphate transport system permease subunit
MPLFIAALLGGLVQAAGTLVGKVLLSLGIGYVTYSGVDTSIAWVQGQFLTGLSGLPAVTVGLLGILKVGVIVSMLTSAITARLVLKGLTSGSITRMVQR